MTTLLKSNRKSFFLLSVLLFFSMTSEFWANNKPLLLIKNEKIYFPIFVDYYPTEFGIVDSVRIDYKALNTFDFILWPLIKWDPYERNQKIAKFPSPPSSENWLGTDEQGRDVLTRLIYGMRYVFIYASGVWICSFLLGVTFGGIAGFYGGKVDLVISRLIEAVELLPSFLIVATFLSLYDEISLYHLIMISSLFFWFENFHQVRGQVLKIKKFEYILNSRVLGATHFRIMFFHIIPQAIFPLWTLMPFTVASLVSYLSVLDFLGLGRPAPYPNWGEIINQGQKYFSTDPWLLWAPISVLIFILILLVSIYKMGDQ